MNKLLPKTTLILILFITAIAIIWLPIQADEPTAVHLASFDVEPLNNAVRINWETATEIGTAGFKIKRAPTGGNEEFLDYVGDNGFIEAAGNVTSGSSYTATDNQVKNGENYTYILIELENSGTETELARKTVTVGIPPTNTPVVVSGGNGGSSATATLIATATKRATSNPSASATPATNSNTTSSTKTSPSFVTITPKSVQPTATPTRNTTTTNTNQSNNNSDSDSVNETSNQENNTDDTILGVTEVLAQEDSTETVEIAAQTDVDLTQQTQDDYPAGTATAVSSSNDIYPSNLNRNDPVSTPVPVIGSNSGYTGTESDTPTSSSGTTSSSEGQIFLWLGFIVALLIFITGVVGSIILFTRKSQ